MSSSVEPTWIYDRRIALGPKVVKHSRGKQKYTMGGHDSWRVYAVAFLPNKKCVVGGVDDSTIRYWDIEDGHEVGTPMSAYFYVGDIAVSEDEKWIVAGTSEGYVDVWDAESRELMAEFMHESGCGIDGVDLTPDGTKIATGSSNSRFISLWSLTGEKLQSFRCGGDDVYEVKFAPDGCLLAAVVVSVGPCGSVRVFDTYDGHIVADFKINAMTSLAWFSDSTLLFTFSTIGNIHCFDVSSKKTHFIWATHSSDNPRCISLAPNGTFIAACANSSVSFWDTATYQQIGTVSIHYPGQVFSMAMSPSYDLVIAGKDQVLLWNLCDILPRPYIDDDHRTRKIQSKMVKANPETALPWDDFSELPNDEKSFRDLEKTIKDCDHCDDSQQKIDSLTKVIHAHHRKHECETMFADGRVIGAAKSLVGIAMFADDSVKADPIIINWLFDFSKKCAVALEQIGDEALGAGKHDDALDAYATGLPLCSPSPTTLSFKWARTSLRHRSMKETLQSVKEFKLPRVPIYRAICEALECDGRLAEAVDCFRRVRTGLSIEKNAHDESVQWEHGFEQRCGERLRKLADVALSSQNYKDADEHYSTMLSLEPLDRDTLIKRSEVRAKMELWEDALKDTNEAIRLEPSSHLGYEQKRVILHGAKRHAEAVAVFDVMLLKIGESSDDRIRKLRARYADARPKIQRIVHATISDMPQVLIDTVTGQLLDKTQQAAAFEAEPIFSELVSSMTAWVDEARIREEVKKFYRYVMLSHKWQHIEPRYRDVKNTKVYALKIRSASKLKTFCALVRSLGIRWAWCDTCCIDQENNVVLQESLVAMFTWYRGSSLTIIYLHDVPEKSLWESVWNTRAWTYQEYVAAEVVQFYTEDWKPYLGLTIPNHKHSPVVVSEMERASRVSADQLAVLRPGLRSVREKLYLASMRQSTRVEDIAYSLLGIFKVSIPVIYGEGTLSVGRFLEHILTGSGDVKILAWTGTANDYNSCLPLNLSVYDPLVPPHIPHMETAELDRRVTELRSSIPDTSLATTFYDHLNKLPSVLLASSRLRLPCIVFRVTNVVRLSGPEETDLYTYQATTDTLGDVDMKTASELATEEEYCFVHPWTPPLLDQEYARGTAGVDKATRALRLVARLRQPFGALLLEKVSRVEYRRVASDSLIVVQVREEVSLTDLIESIETIDVQ